MSKEKIVLIGGGGHCRSVIDVLELYNKYDIYGIVDLAECVGNRVFDYEIIGSDDDLEAIYRVCKNAIITIGHIKSNQIRVNLYNKLKKIGYTLPVIVSPLAYVSKYASIDEGSVIMHKAIVNANAKVGKNCIINTMALIEHDVTIGDNCHISTASVINGGVVVKDNVFYGSNAVSKEYITIDGFVKAGSIVK